MCIRDRQHRDLVRGIRIPDAPPHQKAVELGLGQGMGAVVLEGIRASKGMPSAATVITPDESAAIRAYVIRQAWRGLEVQKQAKAAATQP